MLFYVRVGDKRVVLIKGQARFLFVYFLFFKDINYFNAAETWESHKQKDLKSFDDNMKKRKKNFKKN